MRPFGRTCGTKRAPTRGHDQTRPWLSHSWPTQHAGRDGVGHAGASRAARSATNYITPRPRQTAASLAGLTAEEPRRCADSAVDVARMDLHDSTIVMRGEFSGTIVAWIAQGIMFPDITRCDRCAGVGDRARAVIPRGLSAANHIHTRHPWRGPGGSPAHAQMRVWRGRTRSEQSERRRPEAAAPHATSQTMASGRSTTPFAMMRGLTGLPVGGSLNTPGHPYSAGSPRHAPSAGLVDLYIAAASVIAREQVPPRQSKSSRGRHVQYHSSPLRTCFISGIARAGCILRRAWRTQNRGIHNRPRVDEQPLLLQQAPHQREQLLRQVVLLQQMAKAQNGRLIRPRLFAQLNARKAPDRLAVVQRIPLGRGIGPAQAFTAGQRRVQRRSRPGSAGAAAPGAGWCGA